MKKSPATATIRRAAPKDLSARAAPKGGFDPQPEPPGKIAITRLNRTYIGR